jgi:quinol monooxygenase YgiN
MHGYFVSLRTDLGDRGNVVRLLLDNSARMKRMGCLSYLVSVAADDDVTIWLGEVWRSKEHHVAALEDPDLKSSVAKILERLPEGFSGVDVDVLGGFSRDADCYS